jgi:hypothetical protein
MIDETLILNLDFDAYIPGFLFLQLGCTCLNLALMTVTYVTIALFFLLLFKSQLFKHRTIIAQIFIIATGGSTGVFYFYFVRNFLPFFLHFSR